MEITNTVTCSPNSISSKETIINLLNQLENYIQQCIRYNSEKLTISQQAYQFVEKNLEINDLIDSLRQNCEISQNCLKSQLKNNTTLESLFEQSQNLYDQLKKEFQDRIQEFIEKQIFSLDIKDRHIDIEQIDAWTIKSIHYPTESWVIQCIQPMCIPPSYPQSLKFSVQGRRIIFGIASLQEIRKSNFEVAKALKGPYFMEQDGTHFGFGKSQKQQKNLIPDFTAHKNDVVLMTLDQLLKKISFKNLTQATQVDLLVPNISEDWCFIIGLKSVNECVKLMY